MEDVNVRVEFNLSEPGSTRAITQANESIFINGNLQWTGNLHDGIPYSSNATIVFPKEGDWEITLYYSNNSSFIGGVTIFLNVTREDGSWGWAESHEAQRGYVPINYRILYNHVKMISKM